MKSPFGFLQETKLFYAEMERVKTKLKFKGVFVVESDGEGRRWNGVCLMWTNDCDVSLKSFSLNHIDVMVRINGGLESRFMGIYGHPESENKSKMGLLMKALH